MFASVDVRPAQMFSPAAVQMLAAAETSTTTTTSTTSTTHTWFKPRSVVIKAGLKLQFLAGVCELRSVCVCVCERDC